MITKQTALLTLSALICAALTSFTSPPVSEPSPSPAQVMVDTDYLMALNTADQFLNAWLRRDWQQGPQYLTPALRERTEAGAIAQFFSGLSNPHHQAYELTGLDRPTPDTIRFNLWLYEHYTGFDAPVAPRPAPLILTLTQTPDGAWLVDALPQ